MGTELGLKATLHSRGSQNKDTDYSSIVKKHTSVHIVSQNGCYNTDTAYVICTDSALYQTGVLWLWVYWQCQLVQVSKLHKRAFDRYEYGHAIWTARGVQWKLYYDTYCILYWVHFVPFDTAQDILTLKSLPFLVQCIEQMSSVNEILVVYQQPTLPVHWQKYCALW